MDDEDLRQRLLTRDTVFMGRSPKKVLLKFSNYGKHVSGWQAADGAVAPGDRTAKLTAMRDSRLGFAGRGGAVTMLLARAGALLVISHAGPPALLAGALIVGHSLGRFASALFVFDLQYARQADRDLPASGLKPAVTEMGPLDTLLAGTIALASLLILPGVAYFWLPAILLLPYLALRVILLRVFAGFTGDCLGAAQQIMELGVYLGVVAVTLWL